MKEGDLIQLEGYGNRTGQTKEVKFIGKKGDLVIVESEVEKDGEKVPAQAKLQLANGRGPNAKDAGGFQLSEAQRTELTAKKAASRAGTNSPKATVNPDQKCFCGCGGETKRGSKFVQGHDAKAHSQAMKFIRGQLPEADLTTAAPYVQNYVKEKGGWNSDPKPKKGGNGGEIEPFVREDGTKLFGSAAKAARTKVEKAAAEAAVTA